MEGEHTVFGKVAEDEPIKWPKWNSETYRSGIRAGECSLPFNSRKEFPLTVYFKTLEVWHTVTLFKEGDTVNLFLPLDHCSAPSITWYFDWAEPQIDEKPTGPPFRKVKKLPVEPPDGDNFSIFVKRYLNDDDKTWQTELEYDEKSRKERRTPCDNAQPGATAHCRFFVAESHQIKVDVHFYNCGEKWENDSNRNYWLDEIPKLREGAKEGKDGLKQFPGEIIAAGGVTRKMAAENYIKDIDIRPRLTWSIYPDEFLKFLRDLMKLTQDWVGLQIDGATGDCDSKLREMEAWSQKLPEQQMKGGRRIFHHYIDCQLFGDQLFDMAASFAAVAISGDEKHQRENAWACEPQPLEVNEKLWEWTKEVLKNNALYAVAKKNGASNRKALKDNFETAWAWHPKDTDIAAPDA